MIWLLSPWYPLNMKLVLCLYLAQDTAILTEGFLGFPQSVQATVEIEPQLVYDCFLPNLFQFIISPIFSAVQFLS
jgi:hypothetical protein